MSDFAGKMVISGLGTFTTSVPVAGIYGVDVKLSLPTLSDGAFDNSAVVTVIKQNSSTIYTGVAGGEGAKVVLNCAASDTISVLTSSASAVDNVLNAVKGVVAIG